MSEPEDGFYRGDPPVRSGVPSPGQGAPQGYAPPPGQGPLAGYGPPTGYGPPSGYGAPSGHGAPPGYGPPPAGGPGYGPTPAWGPPAYVVRRPTSTLAILALVFAFVFAPAGLVLGIVARRQIRRTGEDGDGLALAGIVIGGVAVTIYTALFAIWLVALASVASTF